MNIIIDSCVFISVYERKDINHQKGVTDFEKIMKEGHIVWINEHIIDEVLNILLKRNMLRAIQDFVTKVNTNRFIVFTPRTNKEARNIRIKVLKRLIGQKSIKASFTDLYSVVLIEEGFLKNAKLLSYDHHVNSHAKK